MLSLLLCDLWLPYVSDKIYIYIYIITPVWNVFPI